MSGAPWTVAAEALLGTPIDRASEGPAGQLGPTWRATTKDGRELFVKTFARGPERAAVHEAEGLRFLSEAASPPALVVPRVHAVRARGGDGDGLLAIDWMSEQASTAASDEGFGRALATLHRASVSRPGFVDDNTIAGIPQLNASSAVESWPAFYRDKRLVPMFDRASKRVRVPEDLRRSFDGLLSRIDELAATREPPSRLHGDLWAGNRISTGSGSALVDPAAYAGQREVDLAMMRLFGGFSRRVFDAYEEAWPREAGAERRVALYQLYPLLVHVVFFGESYLGGVAQALDDLA